jgi:hypothetical protein
VLHGSLERVGTAELRVDDYETNGPVDHDCEANKENGSCNEACVTEGVGLADDAGAAVTN